MFVLIFCLCVLSVRLASSSSSPHGPSHHFLLDLLHHLPLPALHSYKGRSLLFHGRLPGPCQWVFPHRIYYILFHLYQGPRLHVFILSLSVSRRSVCDERGHHLHGDESRVEKWEWCLRIRLRPGLAGFPSHAHQWLHLHCPEEERMRVQASGIVVELRTLLRWQTVT